MNPQRIKEIIKLATDHANYWKITGWGEDHWNELLNDQLLTDEELQWLGENCELTVSVKPVTNARIV